jgi:hypothetical protein
MPTTTTTTVPADWPTARTIDNVPVVPGMWVLDYNWRIGQVKATPPHESHGVHWFDLTTGTFDGSRMWARHPNTGSLITGPQA